MFINVSGIPVNIIRKKIKNIHLYVKAPYGDVEVTAPEKLSEENVALFVKTKIGWIRKQQEKFTNQERQTYREFVSGETIFVFGKAYYLHVLSGPKYSIELRGDDMYFTARPKSTTKQREIWVNEWYREKLRNQIEKTLPKWEQVTNLHPNEWQIKYMTTRWGTCNTKTGKILFNLQLAKKPQECLDYVILHELIHLKTRNHGKDFVEAMDCFMPFWREIRKNLNDLKLDAMDKVSSYADD